MASRYSLDQLLEMRGQPIEDTDGNKIGEIENIFYDESSREPRWIGLGTGMIFKSHHVVPVENVTVQNEGLRLPYSKDFVDESPEIDGDEIEPQHERRIAEYYNVRGSSPQPAGGTAPERDRGFAPGASSETAPGHESVTRSEEEMHVGKREAEAGHVRLHKWVETERETRNVPLRRETAEVEREPINRPASDAEIGEQDVDVTLREEQPVVEKETVAKERVGVKRREEMAEEQVSEDLRKERVDVDSEGRRN